MKSKLQLCAVFLLVFTQFLNAQIWEVIGSAPNANPKYLATTIGNGTIANPSGKIYVAYVDESDNDHLKVMYYDGNNWSTLGGNVSTTGNVSFPDIKINPNTSEVWVAYRTGSGAGAKLMAKSFDGTYWVTEGDDIAYDGKTPDEKIILQFRPNNGSAYIGSIYEASGVQRTAAIVSNRTGAWANEVFLSDNLIPYGLDYKQYDRILYGEVPNGAGVQQTTVRMKAYNFNNNTWNWPNSYVVGNTSCVGLGITNVSSNFTSITFEDSSNLIKVGSIQTDLTNGAQIDGRSIQFLEANSNLSYLLYTDASGGVFVHEYDSTQYDPLDPLATWTKILNGSVNIGSDTTLAKLALDDFTGEIYVVYKDGNSISVREFLPNQSYDRIYVDANATGNNDGSTWANAFTDLQSGIIEAENTNEKSLWVAAGTYTPHASDRSVSFTIPDEISMYGGFDGSETTLNERDWRTHKSIISGDLNANDNSNLAFDETTRSENSRTILDLSSSMSILIDGFTISGGHANTDSGTASTYRGAAIYADNAEDITLKNMTIENNVAEVEGAVRFRNTSTPSTNSLRIESCIIRNNLSTYGSGITFITENDNIVVNVEVINSLFYNNIAKSLTGSTRGSFSGSALTIHANYKSEQNVLLVNNTFTENKDFGNATSDPKASLVLRRYGRWDNAAALGNVNAELYNNIFANNYSDAGVVAARDLGLMNLTTHKINNLTVDNNRTTDDSYLSSIALNFTGNNTQDAPDFADPANDDFSLQSNSSMINAGDNAQIPAGLTTDLAGNARIENTTVDLGAFEYIGTLGIDGQNKDFDFKIYPNPVSNVLYIDTQNLEFKELKLFDTRGKEVLSGRSQSMDLSSLSKGLYFVKILFENDQQSQVRKIIKN